ncbi:MAG TPA: DUF4169 family protein [Xanthobacteraceae bacterium]|nr:DUF4169 family protein [Xanthobacteraceae bacterium]
MGQVINLRLRRKHAKRQQAVENAAENRTKHGRSRAERAVAAVQSAKARRQIEGHRLDAGDRT